MSGICQDRRSRWQEIQKGLQFIHKVLLCSMHFITCYIAYTFVFIHSCLLLLLQVFIKDLVLNLFGEGNDVFKEGEWTKSIEMYTEALSIAEYADSEEIAVPMGLLENLYVNRAASYLNIGLYDQGLKDCEKALELNEGNYKAHYRKAKSLREMGRHTEAYEAVAKCSLVVPQDPSVIHLTQELAKALGLKIRKAYIRSKVGLFQDIPKNQSKTNGITQMIPSFAIFGHWEAGFQYYSTLTRVLIFQMNNHGNPTGMALGMPDNNVCFPVPVDLTKNPLADTHDFKQACSTCFIKTGPGVLDYTLGTEEHKCKKDALLGRIKHPKDKTWKLIRPRPTKNQYIGPYYICKEVAIGEECLYPGHCTFAYCQEEIDVWTMERKGFISRELLFDPLGPSCNVKLTVPKILQEHRGVFMFLCGVCFDHKPRIISKASQDSPSRCSHPVTKHDFEENKCLVHILKENTLRYSKVRPLYPQCQLDLCRHEVRYGCVREDECLFAHSLVELKVWMMQHEMGKQQEALPPIVQRKFGPPNLKMLFVCGQCWRNGQLNEADKNKKYCSAKARHTWSKDRRVVLVSSNERKKWTTVRALPTKKPIPSQFEICMHVTAGKKCQYIGNCSFAHGTEERDLWTYMKENNIQDMDQLYELWLLSQKPGWSEENSNGVVRENGRQIVMPTDFAEEVSGNHCWLCGKNCNSDKQWQQHITSEKHKDKVFNSEDDQNCWQYRFPTGTFKVCERYLKGTCTEQEHCQLAHSNLELKEWIERREFLLMKLAKARKDHLIAPMDNDFGKYSFLLKDIQ
uniref:Zinc finger CCCH-type containing 7A n=1 Tax=Gadus morhua TaxID=8049 RepID=A0A8C5B637_GADMO